MTIKITTKKRTELSNSEKDLMDKARMKEWGTKERKDYDKFYEPNTLFFFVKNGNKIVLMGGLRPIKINYLGKKI